MDPALVDALIGDVVTLTEMIGPTGGEAPVQDHLEAAWRAAGCETRRSRIGNLYARVGGSGPRLLVAAHADEIGLRVKSITADGFLRLTAGGGGSETNPPDRTFVAQACVVVTADGLVDGVVGTATGHVMNRAQRDAPVGWGDLFLDIGVRSADEARALGVHVGAPVVLRVPTRRVGANLVGKAMDDRALLAVMTQLAGRVARERLAFELWFASTVQEEIGLVGASSVADFDAAIALEVGLVGDIPTVGVEQVAARLGGGPILGHKDGAVVYDVALTRRLEQAARRADIAVQHGLMLNFTSDGKAFMANDVPSALLCVPTRYTHTPIETIDVGDLVDVYRLLEAFVTGGSAGG